VNSEAPISKLSTCWLLDGITSGPGIMTAID
jgi:hypothetical protein